jgi:GMP synthase-like glutamine amidotransferase
MMILLVSMSKPGDDYRRTGMGAWENKLRFEEITGRPCVIQHYSQVTPQRCQEIGARAIFISGFGYGIHEVDTDLIAGLQDVVLSLQYPVLGACGGHQLLEHFFTKDFRAKPRLADQPMRKLGRNEAAYSPTYYPGYFVETGMQPVEIVKRDPLFRGLPRTMMLAEAHYCEIKTLPPGFELLASNEACTIQAMRLTGHLIYGTQFHAEAYTEAFAHGKRLLTNFFALAGLVAGRD